MVTMVVVVPDKGVDLAFAIAERAIVFQQDATFQGLVPALDLALGLGMVRRTTNVIHATVLEPLGQIAGNVGRAVVAEHLRLVHDRSFVTA